MIQTDESAEAVARAATCSLQDAWRQVCNSVWKQFIGEVACAGHGTEEIWHRQTRNFWEVLWTAGTDDPADGTDPAVGGGLLARRKHWRICYPPGEPGDKCTVMHDWQEISGFIRAKGKDQRKRQDEFWDRIRNRVERLNLREDERLCAVAFVKRLFPLVPDALGWKVDATRWPSTLHLGALPWIKQAEAKVPQEAERYAEEVQKEVPEAVLKRSPMADIGSKASTFARLDANWLHLNCVRDERLCPLPTADIKSPESSEHPEDPESPERRKHLVQRLEEVYKATDNSGRPLGPSSFYALLKADGDRLGKLGKEIGQKRVGKALTGFTRGVPEIVKKHDGVTVYAGGDDVLALLPVPGALSCAEALSDRYRSAFEEDAGADATLSAAIVFAHIRLPLRSVLSEAGRLLDDVAKDDNGRDSLAVGVLKPGGRHSQWVTTWKRHHPQRDTSAVQSLSRLVDKLSENADDPGFSSSLVYRIRETLSLLCNPSQWEPGIYAEPLKGLDVEAFLRAEILHSLTVRSTDRTEERIAEELTAEERTTKEQVAEKDRIAGERAAEWAELVVGILPRARADESATSTEVGFDGLLSARFLADPEVVMRYADPDGEKAERMRGEEAEMNQGEKAERMRGEEAGR